MADANYYDPNAIPQDHWWDNVGQLLSHGILQTPSQKYMNRLRERDMVQRYAATPADVEARIASDKYNTARDQAGMGTITPEAQAQIAEAQRRAAMAQQQTTEIPAEAQARDLARRTGVAQTFAQFPAGTQPGKANGYDTLVTGNGQKPGAPDSGVSNDHSDSVWKPFEAGAKPNQNMPLTDMEQPSRVGPDGSLVIPGVSQPQAAPQMARPNNPYVQKYTDWYDGYKKINKTEPTQEESRAAFDMFSGKRPLTGDPAMFNMFHQHTGGDMDKAADMMRKYKGRETQPPEIKELEYFKDQVRQEAKERGVTLPERAVNAQAEARQRHQRFYGRQTGKGPQTPQEIAAAKVAEEGVYLEGLSNKQLDTIANDDSQVAQTNPARVTAAKQLLKQRAQQLDAGKKATQQAEQLELTPEEVPVARGLKQQGMSAEDIAQTILSKRQNANAR